MPELRILIICIIAVLIVIDGLGSILFYWGQHWYEHLIRVLRMAAGVIILCLSCQISNKS